IWKSAQLEAHPISVLTGTPVIVGDRLIVPISSIEEAAAMSKAYSCCTFRGSVAALDLASGKLLWKTSMIDEPLKTVRDKEGGGPSSQSGNCPTPLGPDYDFGATPILMTLPGGKQVLVAGQKSGIVYGLNPDTGALLWKTVVGLGSALGGVEWGIGADDKQV